jgi:signal transduction histidine kinase
MIFVTVRDMSQLLELEKHKNVSKAKTIAFAQAAHEFRNPLNGIIASLEMLEK